MTDHAPLTDEQVEQTKPGMGPLPSQFSTYSDWWIAERVACSGCGQQLTTRWKERTRKLRKRLHHLRMIPRCLRFGKACGALSHARKVLR